MLICFLSAKLFPDPEEAEDPGFEVLHARALRVRAVLALAFQPAVKAPRILSSESPISEIGLFLIRRALVGDLTKVFLRKKRRRSSGSGGSRSAKPSGGASGPRLDR